MNLMSKAEAGKVQFFSNGTAFFRKTAGRRSGRRQTMAASELRLNTEQFRHVTSV